MSKLLKAQSKVAAAMAVTEIFPSEEVISETVKLPTKVIAKHKKKITKRPRKTKKK